MIDPADPTYLGNEIYANLTLNGTIRVTTDNYHQPTNEVFFDDLAVKWLVVYALKKGLISKKTLQDLSK